MSGTTTRPPSDRRPPRVTITAVAEVSLGKTPRRAAYRSSGEHRVFKYRDIQDNRLILDQLTDGFVGSEDTALLRSMRPVQVGDVLVGASGHSSESIGRKVAIVEELPPGGPHYFAGELLRIRPDHEALDSRWIYYFLSSDAGFEALQGAVSGVHLTNSRARQISIPMAPLTMQKAVCDALDRSIGAAQSAGGHLAASRSVLDRFRRAVLTAGCAGVLTADWRERHETHPGVSVREAIGRRTNSFPSAKSVAAVSHVTAEGPIPLGWEWASLGQVAEIRLGGTPSRQEAKYWGGGVPWVSSGEVANCRILSTRETITDSGLANSNAKVYPAGTVLIAMIGEGKTRGQSAILDVDATTNQNAAGVLADRTIVDPEYLWRWALAQYEVTRAVGRGGSQPALNGQKVRELALPVPPLEEQAEIVRRTDGLLAVASSVQLQINSAVECLARMSASVTARSFAAELPAG